MAPLPTSVSPTAPTSNTNKDIEVTSPPEDAVSALAFSPPSLPQNFLLAASWDNMVRCWEVHQSGATVPKAAQCVQGPVLDVCWDEDGTRVFTASCDTTVQCWDLASNKTTRVAQHDAPVRTCHLMSPESRTCIVTGSWDKTLKFWDVRCGQTPIGCFQLSERLFCADVQYPVAVVGTADKKITVYQLDNSPRQEKRLDSVLKNEIRCVAIFRNRERLPTGYAYGSAEGKVAVHYVNPPKASDNFTFKCHRINPTSRGGFMDIYPVNDLAFHPVHNTLVTVGSDGTYCFWDKDSRTKLFQSGLVGETITKCAFNHNGQVLAYAVGYDWSRGHEYNVSGKKNQIFLRECFETLKAKVFS